MYHGRFKGTHYEAGHKWRELLCKNNNIISNKHTLRKNNNTRDIRVVILIITLIYVIIAIRK